MTIEHFVAFFQAPIVSAFNTLLGIVGFALTVYTLLKTNSIDKTLKKFREAQDYNKKRKNYALKFKVYREINENDEHKKGTFVDIIEKLIAYKSCFGHVLSIHEKIKLFLLIRYLKKDFIKINFSKVARQMAELSGQLQKEREI